MKKFLFKITAVSMLFLFSCNESEELSFSEKNVPESFITKKNILSFKDKTEFLSTVDYISSLNKTELVEWEITNKFESFGRISDKLYEQITAINFKNEKDLTDSISKNSYYLQILKSEDNDMFLKTIFFDHPERYLMNIDRMYIIGDTVYKQLDNGVIYSHLNYIENLKKINSSDSINESSHFIFLEGNDKSLKSQSSTNSTRYYYDTFVTSNSKSRMEVTIHTSLYQDLDYDFFRQTYCRIENFKKILFIWVNRYDNTFSYDLQIITNDNLKSSPIIGLNNVQVFNAHCYRAFTSYYHYEISAPFFYRIRNVNQSGNESILPYFFEYHININNNLGLEIKKDYYGYIYVGEPIQW